MKGSKSVIIIGGGVSGLIAATTLIKTGEYSVTLLEADSHIGGRIKTRKFGKGHVEFGAQWVHGERDNRIYEVMEPLGVLVNETPGDSDSKPLFEGFVFATQDGEIMNSKFNQRLSEIFTLIEDGDTCDDEDEIKSEDDKKFQSLGEYAIESFEKLNEESPVHHNTSIHNAALDFIHRYFNVIDAADTWFLTSHCDFGERFEFCEGNALVGWKSPATYSSVLRVILGQSPNETCEIVLPEWIKLEKEVVEIIYSTMDNVKSLVTVSCKDGTIYKADHVLTTVSLGVLKENHSTLFIPNLPPKKQLAIENLGFGTVNKIYLEYSTAWWEVEDEKFMGIGLLWEDMDGDVINANWLSGSSDEDLLKEHDGIPVWCRSLIDFNITPSKTESHVLQGWISGVSSRFMETLDVDYVTSSCSKVLKKFLSKKFSNISEPINSARSTWFTNPFTRGSYSFRTVESDKMDVWASDLANPILNTCTNKPILTFAGEATHGKYYSTVNGAYDTGAREANRIIEYYNNK